MASQAGEVVRKRLHNRIGRGGLEREKARARTNGERRIERMSMDYISRGKAEILEDIHAGIVPADIKCFGDLHDYVDANCYGGLCDDDCTVPEAVMFTVADTVAEALHQWIVSETPFATPAGTPVPPHRESAMQQVWDQYASNPEALASEVERIRGELTES
jgi:hypothetical protein